MRVVLSWSSGKDSAWTLYQLQQDNNVELVGLFNSKFNRVAMHAVRERPTYHYLGDCQSRWFCF